MVAADDLVCRISHRTQEIVVGVDDVAIEIELDNRLDTIERRQLTFSVVALVLLRRNIGGELDDLGESPATVENRDIAFQDPDLFPAVTDPLVFSAVELAAAKLVPECLVIGVPGVSGVAKMRW